MFTSEVEKLLDEIAADNLSGAAELTVKAANTLKLVGKTDGNTDNLPEQIVDLGVRLIAAQPSMGSIFRLVNGALLELNTLSAGLPPEHFIERYCQKFMEELRKNEEALYRKAAGILRDGDTVLTHSASSTVRATILAAVEAGKRIQVICTESRPAGEGLIQAKYLAEQNIPVSVIPDAGMAAQMQQANVVIIGADTVCDSGFYNKIGTFMLGMAAQAGGVDLYVLCTSHKFLPANAKLPPQKQYDPEEVWATPPPGGQAVNIYFEKTPLKYCAAVITESGIIKPAKLRQKLKLLEIDPRLQNAIGEMSQPEQEVTR